MLVYIRAHAVYDGPMMINEPTPSTLNLDLLFQDLDGQDPLTFDQLFDIAATAYPHVHLSDIHSALTNWLSLL